MGCQVQNSRFLAGADIVSTFLITNLSTALLLMSVIGAPFALLGLCAIMSSWARGQQPEFFAVYGGAIRKHWRKALALGILNLALGGLILLNAAIFQMMSLDNFPAVLSLVMTLSVACFAGTANLFAWNALYLLKLSLPEVIKLSCLLVLSYPLRSLLVAAGALLPLFASLFLPIAFFLFVSLSLSAYLAAKGCWWILQRHFSPEALRALLS